MDIIDCSTELGLHTDNGSLVLRNLYQGVSKHDNWMLVLGGSNHTHMCIDYKQWFTQRRPSLRAVSAAGLFERVY